MVLIFSIFDAFVVVFSVTAINKWPLVSIFTKAEAELLDKQGAFAKIGSLDSLKNGKSGLKIRKISAGNTFSSSATGTNAIRLITTPVAAQKLQPVFCRQQAIYKP